MLPALHPTAASAVGMNAVMMKAAVRRKAAPLTNALVPVA